MVSLVDYENILFNKRKLTTSDLLTKKETVRELCSSIPALQAEKVSWLMGPPQATENTEGPLFKNKNIGARPLMLPLQQTDICIATQKINIA